MKEQGFYEHTSMMVFIYQICMNVGTLPHVKNMHAYLFSLWHKKRRKKCV